MNKIENFQELFNISDLFSEKEIYFSEDIFSEGKIKSIIEAYNMLLKSKVENKKREDYGYSIITEIIDGKKYFKLEKIDLVENKEKEIILNLLEEKFGEFLKSVGIFGSYITKENGKYSDYDLVIVLNEYKNDNIYEREKASPKLKRKLLEKGVKSLFAFNFITIQELENANENNPWLLETMGKSFHILKDGNSFLEKKEIKRLYKIFKDSETVGKKHLQDYLSVKNNIDFSDLLKQNNFILESLQYRYLALKNILSELLHKTGNFILDGEFTQKFLQIFGNNLDKNIYNSFFENIFKTEQILGRIGYLSFDLNSDGSYIFENRDFDYNKLIY